LELGVLVVHDLQDRRRLVVLDERIILRADGVRQALQDVIVGVHRLHVEVDHLFRLPVAWLHLVDGVHVGLGVGNLKGPAPLLLDHAKDRLGRSNALVDHLLVHCHFVSLLRS